MARLGRGFPNQQRARVVTVLPAGATQALAGSSALTTTATGDVTVAHSLAASSALTTADTAALTAAYTLAGSSALTTADTAALGANFAVAGLSALTTGMVAAVAVAHTLAGSSALTTGMAADLTVTAGVPGVAVALTGASSLFTGASATTMAVNNALVGLSNLRTSSGPADMTVHFTFQVEGTSRLVSGAVGDVGVTYGLVGTAGLHTGALGTVTPDPVFTFTPPIAYDVPSIVSRSWRTQKSLFKYYGAYPRGRSVVKVGGHYVTMDYPLQDLLVGVEGRDYFLGGHVYVVTKSVSQALIADGYVTV